MAEKPEVRLARRLLEIRGLKPPVDIDKLIQNYATIEYEPIPFGVDGLCLDLKIPGSTKVIVNNTKPKSRQRFTAAHELGHIVIPWHFGSIVDANIDRADPGVESVIYAEQEAEANRFASEILMPSSWIIAMMETMGKPDLVMQAIMESGVSAQAASIKMKDVLPAGFIVAQIQDSIVNWSAKTRGTITDPPQIGTLVYSLEKLIPHAATHSRVENSSFVWWRLGGNKATTFDPEQDWRDVLGVIFVDTGLKKEEFWRGVSGLLAQANSKVVGDRTLDTIYDALVQKMQSRRENAAIDALCKHPRFHEFLSLRAQAFL